MSCFKELTAFNANSVDPDQTQRSTVSDLGLHGLPMSLLRAAGHKWINMMLHISSQVNCFNTYKTIRTNIVVLQWLEHLWDHGNLFYTLVRTPVLNCS